VTKTVAFLTRRVAMLRPFRVVWERKEVRENLSDKYS